MANAVATSHRQVIGSAVPPRRPGAAYLPQVAAALLGQPRTLLGERQAKTLDVLQGQCPGFHANAAWS